MHVTASIGGVISPENGKNLEELYKNADSALYVTKGKGKNGYTFFEDIDYILRDKEFKG